MLLMRVGHGLEYSGLTATPEAGAFPEGLVISRPFNGCWRGSEHNDCPKTTVATADGHEVLDSG
jgi:hypothetical protein